MPTENHSRTTVIVWKTSQGLEDDPEKMGIQNVQMRGRRGGNVEQKRGGGQKMEKLFMKLKTRNDPALTLNQEGMI